MNIPGKNGIRLRIEHDIIYVQSLYLFAFYLKDGKWYRDTDTDGELYADNMDECLDFILNNFDITD